jgi:acyl-CoA dehydrogenase
MVARSLSREAFGGPLARQGVIREWIAESRLAIEQARLLVLKTAWLIDTAGVRQAASEIAAIKVAAPRAASYVLDRAIQTFGAAGVSGDTPLAQMWAGLRTLHLADGPDEVHLRSVARVELAKARAVAPSSAEGQQSSVRQPGRRQPTVRQLGPQPGAPA